MNRADVSFSELNLDRRSKAFISFPSSPTTENYSPRISSAFTDILVEAHGEDFFVNYVRDRGGNPWLAVTTDPEAVDEGAASTSLNDSAANVNSLPFARLLAKKWGDAENGRGATARLYYAYESEQLSASTGRSTASNNATTNRHV